MPTSLWKSANYDLNLASCSRNLTLPHPTPPPLTPCCWPSHCVNERVEVTVSCMRKPFLLDHRWIKTETSAVATRAVNNYNQGACKYEQFSQHNAPVPENILRLHFHLIMQL